MTTEEAARHALELQLFFFIPWTSLNSHASYGIKGHRIISQLNPESGHHIFSMGEKKSGDGIPVHTHTHKHCMALHIYMHSCMFPSKIFILLYIFYFPFRQDPLKKGSTDENVEKVCKQHKKVYKVYETTARKRTTRTQMVMKNGTRDEQSE